MRTDLVSRPTCLALALLALTSLHARQAYSQTPNPNEKLQGTIVGQAQQKYALALPPVAILGGAAATQAGDIGNIVRADLEFSGSFELLDPTGEGRIDATRINDPKSWAGVGAQYLGLLTLRIDGTSATRSTRRWRNAMQRPMYARSLHGGLALLFHAHTDAFRQ